jgi:type IV secretory pathway TrbF-like protein
MYEDLQNERLVWWLSRLLAGETVALIACLTVIVILAIRGTPQYVLEVNSQGAPVGKVEAVMNLQDIPDAELRGGIGDFVSKAFTVYQNPVQEKDVYDQTRAKLTGQAAQWMDDFYHRDHDKYHPLLAGNRWWEEAHVLDTLTVPLLPHTYQVEYAIEQHWDQDQRDLKSKWRMTLHLVYGHPQDSDQDDWYVDTIDAQEEQ